MSMDATERWERVRMLRTKAAEARHVMDTSLNRQTMDATIKLYTESVDQLMVEMNELAVAGVLQGISEYLEGDQE